MTFMNTSNPMKYIFTNSKQKASFLDMQDLDQENSEQNFTKNPLTVWHYFTSTSALPPPTQI